MSRRVRVGDVELAYEEKGAGVPLVLLHGFPFNRTMWREQARALSASYRVITPDLRGHGESDASGETATMEELAADVASLLDELSIERVLLGGLSMGGYVALAFYRSYRERVLALVLADTRAQADTDEARRVRGETAARILRDGMEPVADSMLPRLLAADTLAHRPEVVARLREMMLTTRPEGAVAALRGMAARRDQTDLLSSLSVPTLVIVGEEDALSPPPEAEAMCRRIPGAHLEVIAGAGHVSNLERPEEFNRAVAEFLGAMRVGES